MSTHRLALCATAAALTLGGCTLEEGWTETDWGTGAAPHAAPYAGGWYAPSARPPCPPRRVWCERCDRWHGLGSWCRKREKYLVGFECDGDPVYRRPEGREDCEDHRHPPRRDPCADAPRLRWRGPFFPPRAPGLWHP